MTNPARRPDPAEISRRPGLREIEICYHPGNEGSRRLYARHGFVEQGLDAEGEDMLAVLSVGRMNAPVGRP